MKKHIEQIFGSIPQNGIITVEIYDYADTMLCPHSKNAIHQILQRKYRCCRRFIETKMIECFVQ